MTLSPQADLSTEPRWPRINGTFGEDPDLASRLVEAYVAGFQNGGRGLNPGSVVTVVKHWVGYGAPVDGFDAPQPLRPGPDLPGRPLPGPCPGRSAVPSPPMSPGIMPTYSVPPQGLTLFGRQLERVGAGFSKQLLTDLLRGRFGFDGVILSDWAITADCDVQLPRRLAGRAGAGLRRLRHAPGGWSRPPSSSASSRRSTPASTSSAAAATTRRRSCRRCAPAS